MALLNAASIEAVKDSLYVQVTVAVVVVCLCTRILSSHRFKQIKYSKAQGIEPPTLPYWVPFLKHAFSMAWDMRRFSARSLNKYDDGTPFFLDAAGTRMLLVADPAHIKKMMSASKEADPNPFIHEMILGQMLGAPKDNVDYYRKNDHMHHVQTNQIRQHITGAPLVAMSRIVFQQLKHKVEQDCKSVEGSGWIDIPDLFLYLQNHVTIAIAEALLGSQITEFYPEMTNDLWTFMDGSNEIVMGLPRFAIPKAFAARDRLLANLKRWARMSDELRISGKADPVWDSRAGSGLLQQRQELYQKTPTFDEDACVAQVLGLLFGGNSITPTITFWYVFHAMRDQKLSQEVLSNLHAHFDTNAQAYDFMQLTTVPILRSSHAETTRLYASNLAVRVITSPTFALDDKYVVKKGTQLLIHNKFTGLYTKGWTHTRPSSTQRPLEEFWPERFLIPGDGKPRFSDVGLQGNWTSYGGGEHKCPGRFFALNIGVVALAVMFGEFECELVDQEALGDVMPELRETAFGKAEPTIKIRARLRRKVKSHVETP